MQMQEEREVSPDKTITCKGCDTLIPLKKGVGLKHLYCKECKAQRILTVDIDVKDDGPMQRMTPEQFVKNSMRTIGSEVFFKNKSGMNEVNLLKLVVLAAKQLDVFKKAIFYGNPDCKSILKEGEEVLRELSIRYIHHFGETKSVTNIEVIDGIEQQKMKHVIYGLITETAECVEVMLESENISSINHGKMQEELGDLLWYIALYCSYQEISFADLFEMNADKLMNRFPDGFTQEDANNRDDK